MKLISKLLLISLLNVLWTMIGYAAPLLDTKDTWNQNMFAPAVKTACSPDGQCWGWLPIPEKYDVIISEQESDTSRLQSRRQIANPISEFALRSLKKNMFEETGREIRPSLSSNKQIPTKIAKKDMFMSRNWGAGGMPFSVLYMKSHGLRSNHAVTATSTSQARQEFGSTTESSTSFAEHSNSRIASRNSQPNVQSRRYWTIPQLFISYGHWGSFGK